MSVSYYTAEKSYFGKDQIDEFYFFTFFLFTMANIAGKLLKKKKKKVNNSDFQV